MSKQLTRLENHQTTVDSFGEKSEKQIPSSKIFESTRRCCKTTFNMLYESSLRKLEAVLKANGGRGVHIILFKPYILYLYICLFDRNNAG